MMTLTQKIEMLRNEFHKQAEEIDWDGLEAAGMPFVLRTKRALCEKLESLEAEIKNG